MMMVWALYAVLIYPREGWKVEAAIVADPVAVIAGILFVSLEGSVVAEPSVAAIAISHWMVVTERKRVKMEMGRCEDPFI